MLNISSLRFSFFKHIFLQGSKKSSNFAPDFKIRVIMKRIMLTLVLAIAAGVWSLNWASGLGTYLSNSDEWTVEGKASIGCPPSDSQSDSCPQCIHLAFKTDSITYYLIASETKINERLDSIYQELTMVNSSDATMSVTITGVPFTCANVNYLEVTNITPVRKKLNSFICNQWNRLHGHPKYGYATHILCTTAETNYNGLRYLRLDCGVGLVGLLREDSAKNVYYIPHDADGKHEYLLYAFNAKVGDKLSHLWIGGQFDADNPDGFNATVVSISDSNPRKYTIQVEYKDSLGDISTFPVYWLEGIGLTTGPIGEDCITPICDDEKGKKYGYGMTVHHDHLLCAYLNGEQIYVSEKGELYGCEYYGNEIPTPTIPSDTIPLYIKDGPGSSTVEPVDPNLIYATLSKDILSIYVLRDMEINMVLYKAPSANHAPAVKHAIKATSFTDSISTTLTESGTYTLELTNPAWDYTIVGTFDYQLPQAVENTHADTPSATKILKDGRLFLRYKGQMYNVQGQQVQ